LRQSFLVENCGDLAARREFAPTRRPAGENDRVAAPSLSNQEVLEFLHSRFRQVEDVGRLGGGFWSAAYAFTANGKALVIRFGEDRSWFEADRSAMAFASAGLPVPEVVEIGAAFGGAYAVSVRHDGSYLELISPAQSGQSAPMLKQLFESLFLVPKDGDLPVGWHWQPPKPEMGWKDWLLGGLVHDAQRDVARWERKLASEPDLERLFRAADSRVRDLVAACPERRDLVHSDLLHANVLVSGDASRVNAVFSWKCSLRGDFLYDVAWCSFWGGVHPGVAAAGPWKAVFSSEVIAGEPAALADAAERHHCYELQIGVGHLGWNVWVGNDAALAETTHLLTRVLDRGPLSPPTS
jgi:Phosphotransferase enzyme family